MRDKNEEEVSMRIQSNKLTLVTALFVIFTIMTGQGVFAEEAQAIFSVGWYDVGKAALEGQNGIKKVTSGWRGLREINTVYYDPSKVSIREMEKLLKESGTYKDTIKGE